MKKNIIIFLLCLVSAGISAQTLYSSYFLERMPYRHRLNPALINDYGYFSFPILGNIDISLNGNMALSNFLYPSGNELLTGLHPSIPSKKFIGSLKNCNNMSANIDLTILSFGFFGFNGFNTFDLSFKSSEDFFLPKDLFAFLKDGQTREVTQYDMKDLRIKSNNYIELALGHAHRINDRLTIGAKVKALVGGANLDARIDRLTMTLSDNQWMIRSKGMAELSCAGVILGTDSNGEIDDLDFDTGKIGIAGIGGAIDLGATYKILDNLTVSMALTDIGFIHWNKNKKGETPEGEFIFNGFKHLGAEDDDEGNNAFDDETDKIGDDLEALFKFKETKASSRSTWLKTTMNIGAEYAVLNNKISFGLLSSTRFSTPKTWTKLMATANFRPAKWFMAAINGSVSNTGCSWGALINLCPRGFNLFIGADCIASKYTPQYVPINTTNMSFSFGINFPLGLDPKMKNRKIYNPVPEAY
ncbi:DUF5723 family protein [Coprobacter sp.]